MRKAVWLALFGVVLVGAFFLTVSPARTYFGQQRNIAAAERRVEVLGEQNEKLATRVDQLHTDAEIERLAREQYNLVRPGEEAYAILPAPQTPGDAPDTPAADKETKAAAAKDDGGFWGDLWDDVTFWS